MSLWQGNTKSARQYGVVVWKLVHVYKELIANGVDFTTVDAYYAIAL
jgi:hypothetical protein